MDVKTMILALTGSVALTGGAGADPPPDPRGVAEADAAFRAGQAEKAETLYRRLVDSGSNVSHVHRNLAMLYDDARRGGGYTEKAEELYRRALVLDPADATAHFRLGLHLYAEAVGGTPSRSSVRRLA